MHVFLISTRSIPKLLDVAQEHPCLWKDQRVRTHSLLAGWKHQSLQPNTCVLSVFQQTHRCSTIMGSCMVCVHMRKCQFIGIKIYDWHISHIRGPRQWWQFTIVLAVKSSLNFWHMLEAESILGGELIRGWGQKDLYCQPDWNSAGPGEQSQRQSWMFNQEQHLLQDNYHAGSKKLQNTCHFWAVSNNLSCSPSYSHPILSKQHN